MEAKYDREIDVLRINWGVAEIEESDAISPGVILDYDAQGNVIGIEILNASKKIENFTSKKQLEICIMKKFEQMTTKELRNYIRKHPTDTEAIRVRMKQIESDPKI